MGIGEVEKVAEEGDSLLAGAVLGLGCSIREEKLWLVDAWVCMLGG